MDPTNGLSRTTSQKDKSLTELPLAHDVEKQSLHEKDNSSAEAEEKPKDPNIVDWDGPDDPENPMNWSSKKKVTTIAIISAITFLSYGNHSLILSTAYHT